MKKKEMQNDFHIQVDYLKDKINLDYQYTNPKNKKTWSLKQELEKYVTIKLRNGLKFNNKNLKFTILDQKIEKSGESGKFQFDPFLYAVQIILVNNNGDNFDQFELINDRSIGFKHIQVEKLKEDIVDQTTDDTSIDELMDKIGKKLNIKREELNLYKQNFDKGHIKKVEDMKGWKEQEMEKTNRFPLKVLKQVYKAVNKVNYFSEKLYSSKKLKNTTEIQCSKLANSHKLLRFCIYSNKKQQLMEVSFLNQKAIDKALDIINKELKLEKFINDNLKNFLYQFALPRGPKYVFSRGAIFNGPPGTGKTVITQLLMYLCGFSQISLGISASDFMKTYVGQAGRMIQNLFSRAQCCPYLACSIAIDEIQGAFPNRNDASQKNKGQATSQFLSIIEGNKNIENLYILSSTNHINKIDEAILRRLGDKFDLTRLNYEDRENILHEAFNSKLNKEYSLCEIYLKKNEEQKKLLLNLTMNFTGAAFKKLLSQLENLVQTKVYLQKISQINDLKIKNTEIQDLITKIASEFKIIFGCKTLPQFIQSNKQKKKYLTKSFLEAMQTHFMFVVMDQRNKSELTLGYINKRKNREGLQVKELEELKFNTYEEYKSNQNSTKQFMHFFEKQISMYFDSEVHQCEVISKANQMFNYKQQIAKDKPLILLVQDQVPNSDQGPIEVLQSLESFITDRQNVYVFYICRNILLSSYVGMQRSNKKYSGRIMVEVNDAPRIIFELKSTFPKQNLTYIEHHLLGDEKSKPDDLIPAIMTFFNNNALSNIFLIDSYFIEAKNAFTPEKEIQTIKGVIEEAQKLANVGLIINFDSLLISSKTKKKDNEENQSDIDNKSLYRTLINICRTFSCKTPFIQRWVAIFIKDNNLIQKIRADIYWPEMPQQIKRKKQEEEANRKRICCRCGQQYTERENREERKCFQHPGFIINTIQKNFSTSSLQDTIIQNQLQQYQNSEQKGPPNYIYSCCFANIKDSDNICSKRNVFHHIERTQQKKKEDQVNEILQKNRQKSKKNLQFFKMWSQKVILPRT